MIYTLLTLVSLLSFLNGVEQHDILLLKEVEQIWTQETTLIVYEDQPERGFCQHKCKQDLNLDNGILLKTGGICKCIFKTEKISRKKCLSYCLEDERLEGSERDVCNFIDGLCYTYKFLKIERNEK
jgi:hypothetical protein